MFAVAYGLLMFIRIPPSAGAVSVSAFSVSVRAESAQYKLNVSESGQNLLRDVDGELIYVRHSSGITRINRIGQFVSYCDMNNHEEAVIRSARVFGCSMERYPGNVCSPLNCSQTADVLVNSTVEPSQYPKYTFNIMESKDQSRFTIVSFNCSSKKPMAVTVEVQSSSNVAVLYCPSTLQERSWNPSQHRQIYSFQYGDDRYVVSGDDMPGEATVTQLVVLDGQKQFYTWKVQSGLSCLASYRSVVHNYTCATAAVMVRDKNGLLPEDTLYVAFYHNDGNALCRNAQTYDQYSITLGEGTTVLCSFPMSQSERNVRRQGKEILILNRTHTFKLEFVEIDEQPMLLMAERNGFYIYSIAENIPTNLKSKPADGDNWSTIGTNARNFLITSNNEIAVAVNSSVLQYDLEACSKRTNCDDCLSSNHKYCGWCVLEKRCSTLHGCSSAVKYSDTLYGLWLHAKRNNHCPRLTPSIARTTLSRKSLMINRNSGLTFSGSHFPMKGAYVDDFSCRMTASNSSGDIATVHSTVERLRHPHDELHAEFLCRYPTAVLALVNDTSSYKQNSLNIGITLSYTHKTRSLIRSVDLKTVSTKIVLCEELNCLQCLKEHEACIWNVTYASCTSLLRTSPEEASSVDPSAPGLLVCNSSDVFIQAPRTIRIRSNQPTLLPRNFSHRPVVFFGENLDLLNTTILDTSVGSCAVNGTNYNRDNVTCIMSGEFVKENVTVRFYTDNGTIVCSSCLFRLFDVKISTTPSTTEACTANSRAGANGDISAPNSPGHFRMKTVGTTTPMPGSLVSSSVVQYLLIFIGTATIVFVVLLILLARLHCLTKKGDKKMRDLRERAALLMRQVQGPVPPPRSEELRTGGTGAPAFEAQSTDSEAQDHSSSMESIPRESSSEPSESIYETSG